jgi:hypothetical protein
MAYEVQLTPDLPMVADEDLSANKYRFVVVEATTGRVRRPNTTTEISIGVLQNAPAAAGRPAAVRSLGISKVLAGATVTVGQEVKASYVDDANAGLAVPTASVVETAQGLCLQGGASGDLITVDLYGPQKRPTGV